MSSGALFLFIFRELQHTVYQSHRFPEETRFWRSSEEAQKVNFTTWTPPLNKIIATTFNPLDRSDQKKLPSYFITNID